MFEQYIGDGATLFITIVAIIIGFVTGMGYLDYLKTTKKDTGKKEH